MFRNHEEKQTRQALEVHGKSEAAKPHQALMEICLHSIRLRFRQDMKPTREQPSSSYHWPVFKLVPTSAAGTRAEDSVTCLRPRLPRVEFQTDRNHECREGSSSQDFSTYLLNTTGVSPEESPLWILGRGFFSLCQSAPNTGPWTFR